MRNKLQWITRLLCMAVFLWMIPKDICAQGNGWDGSTTEMPEGWRAGNETITISTAAELAWVAQTVNQETITGSSNETGFEGCTITLANDIDLDNQAWTPIGNKYSAVFKGTFDGNKHVIKNLKIINTPKYAGLFGIITGAEIKNLGVIISNDGIDGGMYTGGIVGEQYDGASTITNCFVAGGPISGTGSSDDGYAGGIVGIAGGYTGELKIEKCFTNVSGLEAKVQVGNTGYACAGGIIGKIRSVTVKIENCSCLNGSLMAHLSGPGYSVPAINPICGNGTPSVNTNNYSSNQTLLITEQPSGEKEAAFPAANEANGIFLTADNKESFLANVPDFGGGATQVVLDDYVGPEGTGDPATPFLLTSRKHLEWLATAIVYDMATIIDKNYQLTENISITSSWIPIGTSDHPFKGTFDGGNHIVTLGIKADPQQAQAGLFGTIDVGATVQKVAVNVVADGITSTATAAASSVGAIAAINNGTIDQCYVSGEGTIQSAGGTTRQVGGIAGNNSGTISNCYNLIPVNTSSDAYIGGIAGYNTGTIEYCFAAGKVLVLDELISSISVGRESKIAGGIVGFNDNENAGIVRNCVAVNELIPGDAHRVIGTGGDADDVNNFSFYDMPRPITKSVDLYNPLEGTSLTRDNLNNDTGGCFHGWNTSVWDLNNFNTLPKLQGYTLQPEKAIAPYLLYTVQFNTPDNGTLSVNRIDPSGSSEIVVNNNDEVPYNTVLRIAATPVNEQYELSELTVNGTELERGSTYTVTSNVIVNATFSKKESKPDPTPDPVPDPSPIYYTVTLPAVEGAVTDPVAGEYEVESWSNFRFYLTLDKEYDGSLPVVTTDRGETLTPRSSDGAYILKYVRTDIQIFIDGIVKNPDPVANEKIELLRPKVWKTANFLHIEAATDGQAFIYTAEGQLQKICRLVAGEIETVQLPKGMYLIRIGKESLKILF